MNRNLKHGCKLYTINATQLMLVVWADLSLPIMKKKLLTNLLNNLDYQLSVFGEEWKILNRCKENSIQ